MGGREIFGDVGWSILSVLALLAALYMPLVYLIGRIRLTDWLGYLVGAGTLVRAGWALADWSVWAVVIGSVVAFVPAFWWARATVQAFRNDPDMVLTGVFVVGRPPERVKGWPDRSRPGRDKPSPG
jgi:4-amino-4-deoxy-L-arabinose transferase-like glycosyltransferase